MPIRVFIFSALLLPSFLSQQTFAQRDLKDIPPPDPELERKTFIVPDGFEVNLYAADPMLAKPIQMNFDEHGRLWIASSEVYPQIKPGQEATDKILVLEDTDADGRAEKTSVFADGLLIPTGVIPGDGGAYVANSTELLHMTDTDGDGHADRTRVILSGFGTEDTHHILHTLRWGPEGLLYFNQSIYIHSHIETPYGVKRLNGGGIWQFRPETMELSVFMRGLVNSWGHHFDDYGQSFATDGAGGEGINYVVPGAYYFTAVGANRIIKGLNPGSPKHCGLEIVSGRHLPEDWQGSFITNDFRGHRVCRFKVTDDGSGFASREQEEVIKSDHVAFRPIDVKIGPDGAIYIADWYNPIIQHGEVDFRDPRRDHTHGRIWRVTCKNRPLNKKPDLATISTGKLLDHLKDPEEWTRTHAKRILRQRHLEAGILASLGSWVAQLDQSDPEVEKLLLEALWTYQAIDVANEKLLKTCLMAKDPRIRAAAVRVIGHWADELSKPLELLERAIVDSFPRVRLEAVRVLGQFDDPRAIEIAMKALDREMDSFLDYALWLTARESRPVWQPLLEQGKLTFDNNPSHLIFAYSSLDRVSSIDPLIRMLENGSLTRSQHREIEQAIAQLGSPDDLNVLFEKALDDSTPVAQRNDILSELVNAARGRKAIPAGDTNRIEPSLKSNHASLAATACTLVGAWKLESQRENLVGIIRDQDAPASVRDAAIYGLADLGGAIGPVLDPLTKTPHPIELRRTAIVAFSSQAPKRAASAAIDLWSESNGASQVGPILNAFLQRQNVANTLTSELASRSLPSDTAKLAVRVISSSGRKFDELSAAFAKAGKIKTGPVVLTPEEMNRMVGLVRSQGDPARGEEIFRREELSCMKCHAIGGAGGVVGPDLISLGASAQTDYIIEALLNPNAKVKENYHTLVVITDEGKSYSGIKVRQTDSDLILRDAEDREVAIALDSIDEQANGVSLMPAGLTEKLTEPELVDLVRFLSELGKLGDYAVSKTPLARRWQVLVPNDQSRYRLRRVGHNVTATDDPELTWKTLYSQVNGELPREDLLNFNFGSKPGRGGVRPIRSADAMAFVRVALEVTTSGPFNLTLNSPTGLTMWVNEVPTEVTPSILLNLPTGQHRITFAVNLSERDEQNLKLELGSDNQAQVKIINGK